MLDHGAAGRVASELMALRGAGRQVAPFSARPEGFDLRDAYEVAARVRDLRMAAGERPVGRKIGFTNRSIWSANDISGPIWNYVFDRTVADIGEIAARFAPLGMPEPRIEPELVLRLKAAPEAGMTPNELMYCVDWVAPGFEIVFSVFPGWRFTAADAAAAFGVHGALFIGRRLDLAAVQDDPRDVIRRFRVLLTNDQGVRREGRGENVLGGPLHALHFLIAEIARYPNCEPLGAGEIVTTGTLTEAMPVVAGQTWSAHFDGIDFAPIALVVD